MHRGTAANGTYTTQEFERLRAPLPQDVLAKALSDAMACRAFSRIDQAFEPRDML